ncbi:MAG: PAS domain S-box protein, partial [Chlorobia bacterium]|nr:PAS domain S-box protein [Fimbriimonadaceae bacterium]
MPTKESHCKDGFAVAEKEPTDMWRLVADSATDAIIAIREEGTIILWNQSAASMFGWRSDEVNGKNFIELVLPMAHRKAISNFIETFLDTGDGTIFEKKIEIFGLAKDGREFPIELSIVPQETSPGHTFVAFVRDMTELKTLNDRIRQSQRMEAIGLLAGGIAHEFNNILASITGNLVLARDDVHEDTAVLESLSEIEKATLRAGYVVRQILTFSTIKPTTSEAIDLERTLSEAIKLLRATLPSTMVIELSCEPDLPSIRFDSTDVHQILLNLGINAQHAMLDHNGKFNVQVSKVKVDETTAELLGVDPGLYVRMSAGDTG